MSASPRRLATGFLAIERGQLADQDRQRPEIGNQVVDGEEEDGFFGGWVEDGDAEEGAGFEVEGMESTLPAAPTHWQPGGRPDHTHHLPALPHPEPHSQRRMPFHQHPQTPFQGLDVQRSAHPQRHRD
ncbi:MAG TPA: hypothetical protein VGK45_09695, partial [Thermoanaerobaculia bacterium]